MSARFLARTGLLVLAAVPLLAASLGHWPRQDVPLASLDLSRMRVQPAGGRPVPGTTPQNVAQVNKSIDGNQLRIGGGDYAEGVGTRATSVLFVKLDGTVERFTANVGADDNPVPLP